VRRSLSLSFGSRPRFVCDHVFGLLANLTPISDVLAGVWLGGHFVLQPLPFKRLFR
jgi:hypothetical protein